MARPWPSLFLTKAEKTNMPYLRGTKARSTYTKPSLQNQLNVIKRQVALNKPAKEYYRTSKSYSSAGAGVNSQVVTFTTDFISSAGFRDLINGDRFTNHSLKLRLFTVPGVTNVRVVLYSPKKVGNNFNPSLSDVGYTEIPDPAAYWVLADRQCDVKTTAYSQEMNLSVSLRGLMTVYNSSSAILEKGELRALVIWKTTSTSGNNINLTYQMCISDK